MASPQGAGPSPTSSSSHGSEQQHTPSVRQAATEAAYEMSYELAPSYVTFEESSSALVDPAGSFNDVRLSSPESNEAEAPRGRSRQPVIIQSSSRPSSTHKITPSEDKKGVNFNDNTTIFTANAFEEDEKGDTSYETDGGEEYLNRPGYARSVSEGSEAESTRFDDDVYDWSDEEDLVDLEAKYEDKFAGKKKKSGWGPKRVVVFLFSTLIGSTFLSAILVATALLLEFEYYKPMPTEQRRYRATNAQAWLYFVAFNISCSWVLAVLIDLVPWAAEIVTEIVWGDVSEAFKAYEELYICVKGWIKPIFYAASIWGSWAVIFANIFQLYNMSDEAASYAAYTPRIYEVVQFLFFCMLLLSIEKLLLHVVALNFHKKAFEDRLKNIKHCIEVLDILKVNRPKVKKPAFSKQESYNKRDSGDEWNSKKARSSTPPPSKVRSPPPISGTVVTSDEQYHPRRRFSLLNRGKKRDTSPPPVAQPTPSTAPLSPYQPRSSSPLRNSSSDRLHSSRPQSPLRQHSRESSFGQFGVASPPPTRPGSPSKAHSHILKDRFNPVLEEAQVGITSIASKVGHAVKKGALHDARNVKGKSGESKDSLAFSVGSAHDAKKLARDIYTSYKRDKYRSYLIPSDFYVAFPTVSEAERAFRVFDADGNGDVSRSEIKTKVMLVYKERRFLSRSLHDTASAVSSLDTILIGLGLVILFFIAMTVFKIKIASQLTSLYTIGIGLSFIFKSAASNAFDSVIFLFVTHPFDTGDRCMIGTENMIVKKMGIFSTVFTRVDGTESYYYNSILFNMNILNVRRSGGMFENMTIQVDWRTPTEKIDELEKKVSNWLSTDERHDIASATSIMWQNISFQRYIELTIGIPHLSNWQDWGAYHERRTRFHAAVKYYMEEIGIYYYGSPQPVTFTAGGAGTYPELSTRRHDERSPRSLVGRTPISPNDGGESPILEPLKPTLGFLPPSDERAGLRRRKTRSRRNMIGVDA